MILREKASQKNILKLCNNFLISIGSILLVLGFIVPYILYPNLSGHPGVSMLIDLNVLNDEYYKYLDVVMLFVTVLVVILFLLGFLGLLGSKIKKLQIFEKTNFSYILLIFFLFVPSFSSYRYLPLMSQLGYWLTSAASYAAWTYIGGGTYEHYSKLGTGYYLCALGILLLLISFCLSTIIVLQKWGSYRKELEKATKKQELRNSSQNKFDLALYVTGLVASIGVILGLVAPLYYWVYRGATGNETLISFLTPERTHDYVHRKFLDFNALIYLSYIIMFLVICILTILSYYKKIQLSKPKVLMLLFLVVILIIPSSTFSGEGYITEPSLFFTLLYFYYLIDYANYASARYDQLLTDKKYVLSVTFWLMVISLILMFLILIAIIFTKFIVKKKKSESLEQT